MKRWIEPGRDFDGASEAHGWPDARGIHSALKYRSDVLCVDGTDKAIKRHVRFLHTPQLF